MKIKYLKRQRINQILSTTYDYPLTIVEAPMGFGKSTAVRTFFETEEIKPIWITFQSSNETALLWDKFSGEIGERDHNVGLALKRLGFPNNTPQIDYVVSLLDNLEYEGKTIIVLDDYHNTDNIQLNNLVLQIAQARIEDLYLVLVTRSSMNIDCSELVMRGFCQIISTQMVKFTEDEIREYCKLVMNSISDTDLNKIIEYADGWISMVYLLLQGMEKKIPIGINITIDELIDKTFFRVYDAKIRDFLMKLSVMDSFTARQAQYITNESSSTELLKMLQKMNSLIYYDELNKQYKIHNIFLDFLRTNQNLSKEELIELHHHMGEWYLEQMNLVKAYEFFYRAGDTERILTLLNNPENIRNQLTQFEGSDKMFKSISQEVLEEYPIAYLQYILYGLFYGEKSLANESVYELNRLQQVYESKKNITERYRNRILAELHIIRKLTKFNLVEESTEENDTIAGLLKGEQSYILLQENEFTYGSPHLIYDYYREPGTLKQLTYNISKKFPIYAGYANGCGTGAEYLAASEYALETGDWQSAEQNSEKAIYKARTKNQYSIIICAKFTLVRLYLLQGKVNEGINLLKQLELEILPLNKPILNTTIDFCKGYIYSNLGQTEKVPYWLQVGDMSSGDLLYHGVAFNYLVYGKAVVAARNYVKLEVLAESFEEYFLVYHNQLGLLHNGIFTAVARFHLYGMQAGVTALEDTLSKAQADDIIMPFIENAPHIIDMMKQLSHSQPDDSYITKIKRGCEQYLEGIKANEGKKDGLTQREKEILSLAYEGLKRGEIATRLSLSQGTVKTHLQNIYQKLDVRGKSAAIKTALTNGLIS